MRWPTHRQRGADLAFLLLLLVCGLAFFARNAHWGLAADDIGWLKGQSPTVFDQYRLIPRLFFASLYALFGASPIAASAMVFSFHFANSLLVGSLCLRLLKSRIAGRAAAFVFLINPITLGSVTWVSCFSYVLGTSLALLSLLAFCQGGDKAGRRWVKWGVALACYGAGILCSHELFFLPALFLLLGWLLGDGWRRAGVALSAVGVALATLVNLFVYDFARYGVDASRLISPRFVSALVSSALSFGLSLGLAYPLSFFARTMGFLRACFAEPVRWAMTLVLLAGGILLYRSNSVWRMQLVLGLSFACMITPYIIRLYLMPDGINYHLSYVLSGRVFYLPFTIIALVWGGVVARLSMKAGEWAWLLVVLCIVAYLHALLVLYDSTDFMGLNVLRGSSQSMPPPWTPYTGGQPTWLIGSAVATIALVAVRLVAERKK